MNLMPCPFCGLSDKDSVEGMGLTPAVSLHQWSNSAFVVQCEGCGGNGPIEEGASKAVDAWNTRADCWRPIEEAPKDGTSFLIYDPLAKSQFVASFDEFGELHWPMARFGKYMPTHFMPLPNPPKK